MFDLQYALSLNKLFKDFNNQEVNQFLVYSQSQTKNYLAGQVIAFEGEPLTKIGLILDGIIEVQKNYPSGKKVTISQLKTGDVFGEVIIFSTKKVFPSTLVSEQSGKIMFVEKMKAIKMCSQNEKFLKNLLQLLSEKILILDHRLQLLFRETIRQKICFYLLDHCNEQRTINIHISSSREKLAEQFGITRPSLSRELGRMAREGLIGLRKHTIIIKDLSGLENAL